MKKVSKEDLKTDKFQQELQKGFQWTAQHSKAVAIALAAFLLIGAGLSAKSYLDSKKEEDLQTRYYQAEKKFLDKKTAFQTAATKAAQPPPDPKKKEAQPPADPTPAGAVATGDFEKDYGPVVGDLEKVISEAPKSKAAKMAALNLSDILIEYKKFDEAQNTLKKVEAGPKDLLTGLVQTQLGTVQANLGDCNSALSTWQKVTSNAEAKSLHSAVKLKQGLCYENIKDVAKAEQMYTEAQAEDKESSTAKAAGKYLRLLQASKQ